MSNRYEYEFKTFRSGKRKDQAYCNIKNVKTGKTIKTVSGKDKLQAAHKAVGQQKRRRRNLESWERMEKEVMGQGGNRTQFERAKTKLRKKKITGKKAERKAVFLTGYSTYVRFFYQSSAKDVMPYIVGESDPEHDKEKGIEYDTYQRKLPGNEMKKNKEWVDLIYEQTLREIKDSDQILHYGGYEIFVKNNETGKIVDSVCRGGQYPLKQGKITKKTRTRKINGKKRF